MLAYGLATPSPDSQTKSYQTEPDEKAAGFVWLLGPEVCRKLEEGWYGRYGNCHTNIWGLMQ